MNFFKLLKNYWRDMTPLEVVTRELALAHLERLDAEGAVEYAQAVLEYNEKRIERLNIRIKEYKQ
jgi:hypothetical protein